MTTQSTYSKQVKNVQQVVIGDWVKFGSEYVTNAFDQELKDQDHSYQIFITKNNGAYFIYAEDHDIEDIEQPKEGFKLLRDAKEHATEFAYFFLNCWLENHA